MPSKKSKQPSFLQRQRQLRAQQEALRKASKNVLPPGKQGGALAPTGSGSPQRALPPGKQGGALARTGSGSGALARTGSGSSSAALRAAAKAGGGVLNKAVVPLAMAGEVSAMIDRDRRWNEFKERTGLDKKTDAQTGGTRRGAAAGTRTKSDAKPTNPSLSSTGVRTPKGNAVPTGSPQYNDYRNEQLAKERERLKVVNNTATPKPSTRSTASAPGSGTQRSTASTTPQKPAMPGRKWDDFNPGRGTSKSNNPLLDSDSGGMKLRDRMKQREANAQGEKAKNLSSNFGQDSGYETKTKVDGSKYANKKPDMKKVNEYVRRKRRYND